jgi:hypothetical protein
MKTITPSLFLEQLRDGAELQPQDARSAVVQVGRLQYRCCFDEMTPKQAATFEHLYRAGLIRMGYPGEFRVVPQCFRSPHQRTQVVDAGSLSSVPEWMQRRRAFPWAQSKVQSLKPKVARAQRAD